MRVEKWYLDCVTDDGAGMIGYAARVGLGPFALRAAETIRWAALAPAGPSHLVLGGSAPVAGPAGVTWSNGSLAVQSQWQPLAAGLPAEILHEDAGGRIEWTCVCPAARAGVRLGPDRIEGLGYVERLVLTLPPTKLPLRELRWGRFVGATHSCVWIRWRGPQARSWCFHNGRPVAAEMPDAGDLSWDGHLLELAPGTVIRSGRIGDTAFGGSRWLRRLVPSAMWAWEETKWCSPGRLTDAHGQTHTGWAIHEIALLA